MITLYSYYRSSASYRVRIALNFKNLDYEIKPIHLVRGGGEQFSKEFQDINPQSMVPCLVIGEKKLIQSMAIMEYLEEKYPEPSCMPNNPEDRAYVRALSQIIACDIHPLNNRRVVKYLNEVLQVKEVAQNAWIQNWIYQGFNTLENLLSKNQSTFCYGESVTMADMCLIPQIYNAQRFNCDVTPFPNLMRINELCQTLPFFQKAHPNQQPDAEV